MQNVPAVRLNTFDDKLEITRLYQRHKASVKVLTALLGIKACLVENQADALLRGKLRGRNRLDHRLAANNRHNMRLAGFELYKTRLLQGEKTAQRSKEIP